MIWRGYTMTETKPLGWHVVSGEDLLAMLHRAADGEDPDMVYMEEWANAEHERFNDDES